MSSKKSAYKFLYFAVHKPYMVLSQFTPEHGKAHLGDFFSFPKDVYSLGRLDEDSEGLLILSNDRQFKTIAMNSELRVPKTYAVQVEGQITDEALQQLASGVHIRVNGSAYLTAPAGVRLLSDPGFPPRANPVLKPSSWISLSIYEGKFRQVRKMTAATGFPTLRLIRTGYGSITLGNIPAGGCIQLSRKAAWLKITGTEPG